MSLLREEGSGAAQSTLCGLFGYSRQAYNKRDDKDGFAEDAIEPIIMEKAREYRKANPGLGAPKLHAILKRTIDDTGCFPGRDAFTEMLRKHGLMVRIKRRRRYKTTDSEHNYRKYPNLIKGVVPNPPTKYGPATLPMWRPLRVFVTCRLSRICTRTRLWVGR